MRDRLPELRRADPSTPLDERYAVVSETRQAYQPCEVPVRGPGLVLGGTTLPAMKKRGLVASNRGPGSYQFGPDGMLTGRRGGGGPARRGRRGRGGGRGAGRDGARGRGRLDLRGAQRRGPRGRAPAARRR